MRWIPLSLALIAWCSSAVAAPVAPGEAAPELPVEAWYPAAPAESGEPTLVLFVAPWCAASRALLDHLEGDGGTVPLRVVVSDGADGVRRFGEIGGWTRPALGADPGGALWEAWLGDGGEAVPLPYAFVVDRAPGGHVLWHGPALWPGADDPLGELTSVLARVAGGEWDVDRAREEQARSAAVGDHLDALRQESHPKKIRGLLDELEAATVPVELLGAVAEICNNVAWIHATAEGKGRDLELALRAIELSMAHGGDEHPAFLDTHARVLWELGRREEALDVQRRAQEMAAGTPLERALRPALDEYAAALGVPAIPADPEPAPEPWQGVINQAFSAVAEDRLILVHPTGEAWTAEMDDLRRVMFREATFQDADGFDPAGRRDHVAILYGAPTDNPWVAEVLAHHGISVDPDGVRLTGRPVTAPDPFLIAALPSPWQPELPVLVYTAATGDRAHGLNGEFHGPTALVIGTHLEEEGRETLVEADLRLEGGRAIDLALGPGELSAEQVGDDLAALAELLHDEYAGHDDVAWDLRAAGTSWEERTAAFQARAAEQPSWPFGDYFDLLVAYLDPIQDTHFRMDGTALGAEGFVRRRAQLVSGLEPFFADGVVDGSGLAIPVVPDPDRVEAGIPYLFPTLPRDGLDPAYLIGVFGNPEAPPVEVVIPSGEETVTYPVHRGRVRTGPRERTYRLTGRPESPLPVLGVWTMNQARLDGLADTAEPLRGAELAVLDLRGNGGGSDTPARDWVARLSHQWFGWGCGSALHKGETDPLRRWSSWSGSRYRMGGEGFADQPFGGRLAVLIDAGVASSGETFTFLASQVEGALLLGENTSGCTAYGNVEPHPPLPHGRVELWFGRSRFVWECVRPVVEGVGIFPDYWLDDPDPVGWLADHPLP